MATTQLPKTITESEFQKLIAQIDIDRRAGRRDRCALRVIWLSGLRISEVVAMVKGDTSPTKKGGLLHVRDGKGRKARAVFIPRELFEEIKGWETQLPAGSRILFPAFKGPTAGRAVSDRNLRSELSKLSRRAGVFKINRDGSRAPVNPHMLRHSYATRALSKGISLREVQHQLGHASILTTQIYLHIQNDQLDERVHLAFDQDRHVDPSLAGSERSALENRVSLALGESPGQSIQERVLLELIARDVASLGPEEALGLLTDALERSSARPG